MTLGLFLLHLMGVTTPTYLDALYMLILGLGLGSVMQVLVIIVQNGVPHSEIGVATAGSTFFRSIGGSFGTAIFGAIFSNVLVGNLAGHLHGIKLPAGFSSADVTPAMLDLLPSAVRHGFVAGYAESIQTVFLVAAPIAALAFLATWLIPQVELRKWSHAAARGQGRTSSHRPWRRWRRRSRWSHSTRRTPPPASETAGPASQSPRSVRENQDLHLERPGATRLPYTIAPIMKERRRQ